MKTDSFSKEKHLPVRRFIADESKVATGLYGPLAIADDIDNIHAMFDPEAEILNGEQKGGIGEQNMQNGAVSYKKLHPDLQEKLERSVSREMLQSAETQFTKKLNEKAEKSATLSGYGITDAYTKDETHHFLQEKQNMRDETLTTENKTISGAINEVKGIAEHGVSQTQYEKEQEILQETIGKKLEETVLSETVVNTPLWTNQPTVSGDISVFSKEDYYYVTLKDAGGNALPADQFMLKDMYTDGALVYQPIFTLPSLATGNSGKLIENIPVEFDNEFHLRMAGVEEVSVPVNILMDKTLKEVSISAVGEFIQTVESNYFTPNIMTDKEVAHYHSGAATTWNSDGNKEIIHYTNTLGSVYKNSKLCDSFTLKMNGDNAFIARRDVLLRYLPYESTTWKHVSGQTIGFGFVLSEDTRIKTIKFGRVWSQSNKGYVRNGTVVRITEVK